MQRTTALTFLILPTALACAEGDSVDALPDAGAERHARPVRVVLAPSAAKLVFRPTHFNANCEYHRAGLYFGTLPADDPRSKRRAFASLLRANGVRSLRFPGGNCSYWYLYDSEGATRELTTALKLGTYAAKNFQNQHFTPLANFLVFCRDYGIEPILQLPTMFYNDGGCPRAILASKYSARAPELYDRNRLEEAVVYIRRLATWTHRHALEVRHWEIGNEEFAHCSVEQFAPLTVAYAKVIRQTYPEACIYVTAMEWAGELLPRLKASGFDSSDVILTTHYPFGNWYLPPKSVDARDPANYLMADMRFEKNYAVSRRMLERLGWRGARRAATETSVIRFPQPNEHSWDPFAVIPSFAHALAFAYNWSVLISQPECTVASFHDLESTYFGLIKYHAYYDRPAKRYAWIRPDQTQRPQNVSPACWFADKYVVTPTATAMGILAELVGCQRLDVRVSGDGGAYARHEIHFIAGSKGNTVTFVALNRTAHIVSIELLMSKDAGRPGTLRGRVLTARSLRSVTPDEISLHPIELGGTKVDLPAHSLSVLMCPAR